MIIPRSHDIIKDVKGLLAVVVQGDVEDTVAISISIDELILKVLHVNLVDWAHKRQGLKSTKRNLEAGLLLRFDTKLINDVD